MPKTTKRLAEKAQKGKKLILLWLMLMVAGFFTAGCTYVAFHQTQRENASTQAATVAQQVAWSINNSVRYEDALAPYDQQTTPFGINVPRTDMTVTNTPAVMIFNEKGEMIYTSNTVTNDSWEIPSGVFDVIRKDGENRVTWQPVDDQRFAIVGLKAHPLDTTEQTYYVVGAVSMDEAERDDNSISRVLLVGSLAYMVGTIVLFVVADLVTKIFRRRS
jgi:hypothetical protein